MTDAELLADRYWRIYEERARFARPGIELADATWPDRSILRGPWVRVLTAALRDAGNVLDVGAGSRRWEDLLRRMGIGAAYSSCDPDRRHPHEHHDFLAVTGRYDAILMLDLLEHLPAATGVRFVDHAAALLGPGGVLVVSTPNPAHPTSFQASDFTHVRAWPAHDLFGLCRTAGFGDVRVHRVQHVSPGVRRALVPVQRTTARILGVDPADHLLVSAII